MADETLPMFKYHPDPLRTGSVVRSDTQCVSCGKVRGYVYVGPVYAIKDYDDCICPWCIADGSAHARLNATFHDESGVGGGGEWDDVPEEVVEEIAWRTPGFNAWQQEQWWTHCGDGAKFLGCVGHDELTAAGDEAVEAPSPSCWQTRSIVSSLTFMEQMSLSLPLARSKDQAVLTVTITFRACGVTRMASIPAHSSHGVRLAGHARHA
jgi:uncharacterized protein CbrC (UPF0167 family)